MKATDFTSYVFDVVEQLKEERTEHPESFRVSDIFDEHGMQYVNLVQEGGGILGLALLGFTYVLEEMGIRFLSLGGTSAGSINTLLLADTGQSHEPKAACIIEKIAPKNFMDFVDGGDDARDLVHSLKDMGSLWFYVDLMRNKPELLERLGINPGTHFTDWLGGILEYPNWKDLEANIRELTVKLYLKDETGRVRREIGTEELDIKLAIVAADITTQTKVEFPYMADLYYADPLIHNPAEFVRASMSIPLFFEPQRVSLAWAADQEEVVRRRWKEKADYHGQLPEEVLFVDGGIMSNFPIDLFHKEDRIPDRPTIGIKLGIDREKARTTDGLLEFVSNMPTAFETCGIMSFCGIIRNTKKPWPTST